MTTLKESAGPGLPPKLGIAPGGKLGTEKQPGLLGSLPPKSKGSLVIARLALPTSGSSASGPSLPARAIIPKVFIYYF